MKKLILSILLVASFTSCVEESYMSPTPIDSVPVGLAEEKTKEDIVHVVTYSNIRLASGKDSIIYNKPSVRYDKHLDKEPFAFALASIEITTTYNPDKTNKSQFIKIDVGCSSAIIENKGFIDKESRNHHDKELKSELPLIYRNIYPCID